MDLFLGMDMQKDTIVHSISTVMLEPTGGNRVVHIDNIKNTSRQWDGIGLRRLVWILG